MNFADLTNTDYFFHCEFIEDFREDWAYRFSIAHWDDKYSRSLNQMEIAQLRENCERILKATSDVEIT